MQVSGSCDISSSIIISEYPCGTGDEIIIKYTVCNYIIMEMLQLLNLHQMLGHKYKWLHDTYDIIYDTYDII